MSIFEYDEEKHIKSEREAGVKQGISQGMKQGMKHSIERLIKNLGVSIEEAMQILEIPPEEQKQYRKEIGPS